LKKYRLENNEFQLENEEFDLEKGKFDKLSNLRGLAKERWLDLIWKRRNLTLEKLT